MAKASRKRAASARTEYCTPPSSPKAQNQATNLLFSPAKSRAQPGLASRNAPTLSKASEAKQGVKVEVKMTSSPVSMLSPMKSSSPSTRGSLGARHSQSPSHRRYAYRFMTCSSCALVNKCCPLCEMPWSMWGISLTHRRRVIL